MKRLRIARYLMLMVGMVVLVFGTGRIQSLAFLGLLVNVLYSGWYTHRQFSRGIAGDPSIDPKIAKLLSKVNGVISGPTIIYANLILIVSSVVVLLLMMYGPLWLASILLMINTISATHSVTRTQEQEDQAHEAALDVAIENIKVNNS
jgi:hypothetical protein